MCGIAGLLDLTPRGRASLNAVRAMTDAIAHRGPDGSGFYAPADQPAVALGMRRLSIIDIGGSDQPLYNEDRTIALVFNGEIYNYRALRRALIGQGHALRTDGDGETIIHLYEQYGLDLFAHLRGMYAFALWDGRARRLVLAVDHIGMKPLYVSQHDGLLRFASEVKAILSDPAVPRAVNTAVLDTYLSFGYMIGEETLFAGVRRLMPGHALVVENGEMRTHPFWQFGRDHVGTVGVREGEQESALIDEARARLRESVRLHLESDVPVGLFLSAGVDSAAVLALMAEASGENQRAIGEHIRTFTVGYAMSTPDNELDGAARIAGHFGARHTARVITADEWWTGFERYVYHHDEPNANPSAVSLLLLSEAAARDVKVVMTGLGGDELFAGYGSHRAFARIIRERRGRGNGVPALADALAALEPFYPAFKRWRGLGGLPTVIPAWRARFLPRDEALRRTASFDGLVMSDTLRRRLYTPALQSAWASARHKERTYAAIAARAMRYDPDDAAQALVIDTWLHGNALLNADKVTMAHSLEARVPFFDPSLLDFAARIPPPLRLRENKYVLREAMRPLLPSDALERPKKPFETPILGWFTRELRPRIAERLCDPGARLTTWIDRRALDALLDGHFSGRAPQVEVVFRLLTLETWLQRFMG